MELGVELELGNNTNLHHASCYYNEFIRTEEEEKLLHDNYDNYNCFYWIYGGLLNGLSTKPIKYKSL